MNTHTIDDLAKISKDVHDWFIEENQKVMSQLTTVVELFVEKGEWHQMNVEVAARMILNIIRLGFLYRIFYENADVKALLLAQKDINLYGCLRSKG